MFIELLVSSVNLLGQIVISGLLISAAACGFIAAVKRKRMRDYFVSVFLGLAAGSVVLLAVKTVLAYVGAISSELMFESFWLSILCFLFVLVTVCVIMIGVVLSYLFFQTFAAAAITYIQTGRIEEGDIKEALTDFKQYFFAD